MFSGTSWWTKIYLQATSWYSLSAQKSNVLLHIGPPGNYSANVLNCRLKQVGLIFFPESSGWQVSSALCEPSPKEGDSFAVSCDPCRMSWVPGCWVLPSVRWSFVERTTVAPRILLDGRTVGSSSVQPASYVTWVTLQFSECTWQQAVPKQHSWQQDPILVVVQVMVLHDCLDYC